MSTTTAIQLTECQAEFLQLDCLYPAFIGGYMCGKSYLMGLAAVLDALHSPEAKIYIYEPENHHIRTVAVPAVEHWLEHFKIKHKPFNKQESSIEVTDPRCGSFFFKPMDNPGSYVGYQSYRAHIDEIDTLDEEKAREVWQKVFTRNRQAPKGVPREHLTWDSKRGIWRVRNRQSAYTTPEGYKFCYKMWEINPPKEYVQVKGHTEQNPAASPEYIQGIIDQYGERVAQAYLHGEFVNMKSETVYHAFDPDSHYSFETIQPYDSLYIGLDFNVGKCAAVVYIKRDGGKTWHAVEELSGVKDTPEMIKLINEKWGNHKIHVYPDASGGYRHAANSNASVSSIAQLQQAGFIVRAPKKNYPVLDRVASANNAFAKGWVKINTKNCPQTTRCLLNQAFDKNGKPDKRTGYDHQTDATTYPIVYEMGLRKPLFPINFSFAHKY
jgi:hypothetical protein